MTTIPLDYYFDKQFLCRIVGFEFNKLNNNLSADFLGIFEDWMLDSPLYEADGAEYMAKVNSIPANLLGLEWDNCGFVHNPAIFYNLHPYGDDFESVVKAISDTFGVEYPGMFDRKQCVYHDVGIFPARNSNKLRFTINGNKEQLMMFAFQNGGNPSILADVSDLPLENAVNFDWSKENGIEHMTCTFRDEKKLTNIHEDPWIVETLEYAKAKVAEMYEGIPYYIRHYYKAPLTADMPEGYFKLYLSVRCKVNIRHEHSHLFNNGVPANPHTTYYTS
jgi:hypothetical protein